MFEPVNLTFVFEDTKVNREYFKSKCTQNNYGEFTSDYYKTEVSIPALKQVRNPIAIDMSIDEFTAIAARNLFDDIVVLADLTPEERAAKDAEKKVPKLVYADNGDGTGTLKSIDGVPIEEILAKELADAEAEAEAEANNQQVPPDQK